MENQKRIDPSSPMYELGMTSHKIILILANSSNSISSPTQLFIANTYREFIME